MLIVLIWSILVNLGLLYLLRKMHARSNALEDALRESNTTVELWLDTEAADLVYAAYSRIKTEEYNMYQIKRARKAAAKIMGIRLPSDKDRNARHNHQC